VEDGPFVEAELAVAQHRGADDVGGHEVGGELDPAEIDVEDRPQRLEQLGLAEPGDAFEEHVPLAEDGQEDGVDEAALADDHRADGVADCVEGGSEVVGGHGSISLK
jgi:hypothetical protein